MTLREWFWLLKFKREQVEAEREAMEEAKTGKRKVKVPASVWKELREEHKARLADGG